LRRHLPPLALALTGQCTAHHGWRMPGALERLDRLDRPLADLDTPIGERMAPLAPPLEPRTRIPGVEATAARAILAEIGPARRHVGSAARLASGAGVWPGHDARAGKRRAGRTRTGNRARRRVLVQCAGAARNPPTFPGRTGRRLAGRLGGQQAAMAVAHQMLVMVSQLRLEGTCDAEERDHRLQDSQAEHPQQRAGKTLERLGYRVTIDRMA
jgi:transposase